METDFAPRPHEEAIALIRGKRPVAAEVFYGLLPELRGRAFTVSGIEGARALQRVRDAIAGLPQGGEEGTWDKVKQSVVDELDAAGFGAGAERRATLLIRTHAFQAFQASNWETAQLDEDTTHIQYLATEDDKVRDSHLALNGLVLPKEDPFWDTHTPPWEWGCRCRIRAMNPDLVEDERQRDEGRSPEDRLVMEGPALEGLRQGTLNRDGRRYDVRPPRDKGTDGTPYEWHPDDLRIPLGELERRYDPEVWEGFTRFAKNTQLDRNTTLLDWLRQSRAPRPSGAARERISRVTAARIAERQAQAGDQGLASAPGQPRPIQAAVVGQDRQLEGLNARARASVHAGEAQLLKLPHERCLVFDNNGNVLLAVDGDASRIRIPPEQRRFLRGRVVTHNHPDGGPFSLKDVITACTYELAELRIVTAQNSFSLRPGSRRLDKRNLENILRAVQRLAPKGLVQSNAHAVWKTVATENGLNYVVS
jgi:SPP1 gp7 family putative phage head morphogenesis protein